jgi:hypothetical protein
MQRSKKIVSVIAILSMLVTSVNLVSPARADSLTYASDLLSSSDRSVVATHTVSFFIHNALVAGEHVYVALPSANFGAITSVICPGGNLAASGMINGNKTATCDASGAWTGSTTIKILGATNPATVGSQTITVTTYTAGLAVKESVNIMVAIVDHVTVTASVPSTLSFVISPLATGTSINSITTTGASATTTIGFGNLTVGTSSIIGQQLQVTTNANYGYMVTVDQNQELTSLTGTTIHGFKDSVASTTAQSWTSPLGTIDVPTTYGHLGLTTDDATLSINQFTANTWKGFAGSAPMEVMYHTGPADGTTQSKGLAKVAYRVEISPLQAAGDYTNTLTYVATPIY